MANLLNYINKSDTIDNKLNIMIANINYDYQNGKIKTETEYYYRIKNMLSEFYRSLNKPTFQYKPAISTPISDEYNSMITSAYSDMQYIIEDCISLEKLVKQSFTDAELSRNMMANQITYLSKQIKAISDSVASNQSSDITIFSEQFNSLDNASNAYADNSLYINTNDCILTLRHMVKSNTKITDISIDDNVSNGLPGNTHCADSLNNELHFIGQDNLNIDLYNIIDGNSDTWFEYELFTISDAIRQQCNGYGFEYDEGVSWVNNDDILRLKLVLDIKSNTKSSFITISPYISDIKGVKSCILESCNVFSSSGIVYNVCSNRIFDDILVLPFPAQQISKVELVFVQPSKYLTTVGHYYYTSADTSDMSIFQEYDYTDMFSRINGAKPSVSLLGCKYNPLTKWVTYSKATDTLPNASFIKAKLFQLPSSSILYKANQELINAYRYMIGIKNIKVISSTFINIGEYVSKTYQTDDVITSVMLEADEYIPGNNTDCLRYYISLNNGIDWHIIYPIHRAYAGVYKYYINNNTIENALSYKQDKKIKNISIAGNANSIKLKIEMDRLYDRKTNQCQLDEYTTPIVYNYKLRLTTGGDSIEY